MIYKEVHQRTSEIDDPIFSFSFPNFLTLDTLFDSLHPSSLHGMVCHRHSIAARRASFSWTAALLSFAF